MNQLGTARYISGVSDLFKRKTEISKINTLALFISENKIEMSGIGEWGYENHTSSRMGSCE